MPNAQRHVSHGLLCEEARRRMASAGGVHGRMPVILARDVEELWLDPDADADAAISILKPYPARLMVARAASPDVNSIRNDYRELVQHAAA